MSMDIDAPVALPSRPLIPQTSATYVLFASLKELHAYNILESSAVTVVHP